MAMHMVMGNDRATKDGDASDIIIVQIKTKTKLTTSASLMATFQRLVRPSWLPASWKLWHGIAVG
jgi:hypothetical protein